MLVTLLAWIFISFLCWAWGILLLRQLKIFFRDDQFVFPDFIIICLAGLAVVTVMAGILSLFIPLGSWQARLLLFIIPCFLLFFQKHRPGFFAQGKNQVSGLHPFILLLLIASVLMVLIMSSWTIHHPDTLTYHAQTIHWIEKYKAIPGLVHLNPRFGYQGLWFVACAFFNPGFTGIDTLTLINSLVVVWYFLFILQKINKCLNHAEWVAAILWLLLFVISCLSYTQVRLTITSASPDFITALFLWTAFYLFLKKESGRSPVQGVLLIALSFFSITLKLSALPVLLLAIYPAIQLWKLKKIKALVVSCVVVALILFPFFARNIVTTGYLFFPSPFPDVVNVDWKFDKTQTQFEKNYITAYARTQAAYEENKVKTAVAMSADEWLPYWWKNQRLVDKMILLLLLISFPAALLCLTAVVRSNAAMKAALVTAVVGTIFWFVEAPDPRFGFGFIMTLIAMVAYLLLSRLSLTGILFKKVTLALILSTGIILSGYIVYRSIYFFSSKQLIAPLGIQQIPSVSFECDQVRFYKPLDNGPCGDLPVPCVSSDSCNGFKLRGKKITDGFRAR